MKFVIETEQGSDVMGGELDYENCYISIYPKILGGKSPKQLEVGESTLAEFSLSGSKGKYWIRRTA